MSVVKWLKNRARSKYDTSDQGSSGMKGKDFKGKSIREIVKYNRNRKKQLKKHKESNN